MIHESCLLYRPHLEPKQRFALSLFEVNERIASASAELCAPALRAARRAPALVVPVDWVEMQRLLQARADLIAHANETLGCEEVERITAQVQAQLARIDIQPEAYGLMSYLPVFMAPRRA